LKNQNKYNKKGQKLRCAGAGVFTQNKPLPCRLPKSQESLTSARQRHLDRSILPGRLLGRTVYNRAHVIEPEAGTTKATLATDNRRATLNIFETEI
jgi:hypothetical protein